LLLAYHVDPQLSPLHTLIIYQRALKRRDDDRFYQRWLVAIQGGNKDSFDNYKDKARRRSTASLTKDEELELQELLGVLDERQIIFKKKK